MFRMKIQSLKNEAAHLKEANETARLLRSDLKDRREELFAKIDGASHDLLSACRNALLREKRQLDLIETHIQKKIVIILSNQKQVVMAINALRNVNALFENAETQTLCELRQATTEATNTLENFVSTDPMRDLHTFENYTLAPGFDDVSIYNNLR
ncbi:unnamed protein product [Dibothriocephalus latus]|uniref:Uncharacterized protein n=1 Tax=Dibothriocephalus latus TaxID=60516 RepID=A0A3P6Q316_DIBLA|nr:unnamed protein product [Dibothriocephalus latus]